MKISDKPIINEDFGRLICRKIYAILHHFNFVKNITQKLHSENPESFLTIQNYLTGLRSLALKYFFSFETKILKEENL